MLGSTRSTKTLCHTSQACVKVGIWAQVGADQIDDCDYYLLIRPQNIAGNTIMTHLHEMVCCTSWSHISAAHCSTLDVHTSLTSLHIPCLLSMLPAWIS